MKAGVTAVDFGLACIAAPWAGARFANTRADLEWWSKGNDGFQSRPSANTPPRARCIAA